MKTLKTNKLSYIAIGILSLGFLASCDNNNSDDNLDANLLENNLIQTDKESLLFMLEEEKLARDTYNYLDNLWNITAFSNIKNSEQSHMNAVSNLLTQYNITYDILPQGEFANQELQELYNQFVIDGQIDAVNALKIGALIEDLDIVDLENYMNSITNNDIILVYQSLQCGSRNHLRSFVSTLSTYNATYAPQFLSQQEYDFIVSSDKESCN